MLKKISIVFGIIVTLTVLIILVTSLNAAESDFNHGVDVSDSNATIWFESNVDTTWVDVHYTLDDSTQQNVRMTASSGKFEQVVSDITSGSVIKYSFTYNNGTPAYDTEEYTYTVDGNNDNSDEENDVDEDEDNNDTSNGDASNSIYSITQDSIPSSDNGAMMMKLMNGTSGEYDSSEIYWGVLGINPENGKLSYLDAKGNLIAISEALNNADGHLTKNGENYANIYHKLSDSEWINLPSRITSGRMFISMGSTCYLKTYDDGFAGPNIDNPTDPNKEIYFDFIEFTIDDTGYHGNTTRVDGFGFPIQHRLINNSGDYDKTVGELESETREGIFTKYQEEVPSEFKDLTTIQAPYRIVAPIHGSFSEGGTNANYFSSYSDISTQDILLGIGNAADPIVCASLNRHVYNEDSKLNNPDEYYKESPANFYAEFWHNHSIDKLAYGFCYDDVNQQAAYLEVGSPQALIVRVGW
jgi:hypothetical protein